MQKYEKIKDLSQDKFRRLTGVKPNTFHEMLEVLKKAEKIKKARGGKPSKLCLADKLLMSLEYLREYRTYFHLGKSYGLSESACFRTCRWIENALIKSKNFSLPGRKALLKSDVDFEVILLDASESPIERPKKKLKIKNV